MLNKRGVEQEVYFMIFEVLMIVFVSFVLFRYVNSMGDNTYFEKNYLARDLSLLTTTLLASPGNIGYTYYFDKGDISKFSYDLENGAFIVSKKESPMYFIYAEDGFRSSGIKASLSAPKQLQFSLIGNDFEIGENLQLSFGKLVCRGVDTKDEEWKKKEIVITGDRDIKKKIEDKAEFHEYNIKTEYSEKTDILVRISRNEDTGGMIKAYVNSEKNNKLACLIINKFHDKHTIKDSAIIPSTEGILLEISSDILESSFVLEIYSGIEEYFTK